VGSELTLTFREQDSSTYVATTPFLKDNLLHNLPEEKQGQFSLQGLCQEASPVCR
jgi:hypothetical protein